MAIDPMWQLEKNRNRRPNMKIRFAHLCSILALLTCASSASAQSANSQPVKTRGIDPALLTRAKAGDAEAELSLALSYCHLGDRKESCRWLRAAAENGDAMAQVAIAGSYESGPSVSDVPHTCACAVARDYAQAAIWYRKAAERGNALAQNGLGRLYADGKGVPQDYAEAFFWLSLASANGIHSSTDDVNDRDLASSHLTKTVLLQTQERARKWFEDHSSRSRR